MQTPNKDYWKDRQVSDYDRKQRLLVPRKDELLDTVVDFLPFEEEQPVHILDVGAGQGALSERILQRFSQAHVTLLDASAEMLAVAEQRLAAYASRVSLGLGDFCAVDWDAAVLRPVDGIVSSIALHFLRTERRLPFFARAYALLSAPGCLLVGDAYNTPVAFIQERCNLRMLEFTRQQLLATEGRDVSIEKLRENARTESGRAGTNRLLFTEQMDLLKEAGFPTVEIVWRYLSMAVVAAYKT